MGGGRGAKGPDGRLGNAGPAGERGRAGRSGQRGTPGPKGDDFHYKISGPTKFAIGLGGDKGLVYSSLKGMFMQHSENPCQIRFVQKVSKKGKSNMPGIISGYFGNVGFGTRTARKALHVKDQCTNKNDAKCADRKGPIILSASWRNVLMSKVKNTYYDMIGSYTNWAGGKSN